MTCGPRGCPGPLGVDQDGNPVNNVWFCDGIACDRGAIHTTCKKAKEAEGYTFVYTERAKIHQKLHDHERDVRLASMPMPMSNSPSRVAKAIQAAVKRLQEEDSSK
jgi:hypothetical protein